MRKKSLSKLMEAELDKAETVLAIREMADKIQGMTEDVAKMRVDTLMPLAETIKEQFGRDTGEKFQHKVDGVLDDLQRNLTKVKDEIDHRAAVLNGDESDMAPEMDMKPDHNDMDMMPDEDEGPDLDDAFGASDLAVGGDEPLGRAAKESRKAVLKSKIRMLEKKMRAKKVQR